mgnify:FL=1
MNYWQERMANEQNAISTKTTKQIEKQLRKYYAAAAKRTIEDFESTYNKLLAQKKEGKDITQADLYRLDKYWEAQEQLRQRLQKLGEKKISLLTKYFELNFFDIYHSIAIPGLKAFNTIDDKLVNQLINSVWVADGRTFSQRVWNNIDRLVETLNEQLVYTVVTGKKTTELKNLLQERFNVSYRRADTLVRTELAHIQTEAAKKRYEDYGIQYIEVLVDADDRTCDECKALIGKKFPIHAAPPLPVHPNDRCTIIPVID